MKTGQIVTPDEWLKARLELLDLEKEQTRAREALTRRRMAMPWVKVEKDYVFDGPDGHETLVDLFDGKDQLIVYHFMFDPDWEAGCKSCSLVADHYDPSIVHLASRDVAMATISKAPLEKLDAFRARMGWDFKWLSSADNDFNRDYQVSFSDEELGGDVYYNFGEQKFPERQAPGVSVFAKGDDGEIYHTYSAYARGLENLIGVYQLLDLVPKGRDEDQLPYGMDWVRLKDSYGPVE